MQLYGSLWRGLSALLLFESLILVSLPVSACQDEASKQSQQAEDLEKSNPVSLTVRDHSRILWSVRCESNLVADAPRYRLILYYAYVMDKGNITAMLVARTYDGKVRWQAEGVNSEFGLSDMILGEDSVLLLGRDALPPPLRGKERYSALSHLLWEAEFQQALLVDAFEIHDGRKFWKTDHYTVGAPFWTNGKVFLSVRYDLSKAAIRRALRSNQGNPPILVEERLVPSQKRVWWIRLPKRVLSTPPDFSVSPHGPHRVRLVGTWPDGTTKRSPLHLEVPIKLGVSNLSSQSPIKHDYNSDWASVDVSVRVSK
jgi:hypothetical protein